MKKIINGKSYNTDTATFIGEYAVGRDGDFAYFCERLYRTRKGQYFLYHEGGPNSKYGKWECGTGYWTKDIELLDEEEAKAWGEQYMDADEYEEVFGAVEEG